MIIRKEYVKLKEQNKDALTNKDLFEKVLDYLKNEKELEDAFKILDYSNAPFMEKMLAAVDLDGTVEAVVNTGGSEGIYIDCRIKYNKETYEKSLGTFKTLEEDISAYIKMGEIAGAFTAVAEAYLYENYELIEKWIE